MVVHQVFAHILDTKIKNVIVCDNYEIANQLARSTYGPTAIGVECTQYPCGIGDYFVDNTFYYRDKDDPEKVGEMVPRKNTAEEDAYEANAKSSSIMSDVANQAIEIEYLKAVAGIEDETTDVADIQAEQEANRAAEEAAAAESESTDSENATEGGAE
jgi:hypothetical protein